MRMQFLDSDTGELIDLDSLLGDHARLAVDSLDRIEKLNDQLDEAVEHLREVLDAARSAAGKQNHGDFCTDKIQEMIGKTYGW
jgi:hypothetical protein